MQPTQYLDYSFMRPGAEGLLTHRNHEIKMCAAPTWTGESAVTPMRK